MYTNHHSMGGSKLTYNNNSVASESSRPIIVWQSSRKFLSFLTFVLLFFVLFFLFNVFRRLNERKNNSFFSCCFNLMNIIDIDYYAFAYSRWRGDMCDATRTVTISHRANRKRYVKTGTHKQIKKKIECIDMMCVLEMSYCSAAVYLFLHCSFLCLCPFFSNSIIEKNMRRKKQPSVCLCTNSSSMQCPQ